jgi:hypothetical protein
MKNIFLISSLLLSITSLFCQNRIGVQAGIGKARQIYSDNFVIPPDGDPWVRAYNVSILYQIRLNKHFYLGLEPSFVKRGAACVPGFNQWNEDQTWTIEYVEAPVLIQYETSFLKDRFSFFTKNGLGFSRVINGFSKTINTITGQTINREKLIFNGDNGLRPIDVGVNSATGLAFNFRKSRIFGQFQYYRSFLDVSRSFVSQNKSIGFGLGFSVDI